ECKPDLDNPGALDTQLLTDVRLGLLDRVVLVTATHVTGAHLNRLPDAVGVWTFDHAAGDLSVLREAEPLPVDEPGIEIMERSAGQTAIRVAAADEITRQRRRLAERAYGSGWRPSDIPGCARADPDPDGIVHCSWKDRIVRPGAECGSGCEGFQSAAPEPVDRTSRRAACSAWEPDPPGWRRTQTTLDRF
ncbi:MAG: DUF5787 family protein, partial [Salinirussus sp.]